MSGSPRLFVSYRRANLGHVRPAVDALRAAGVDCFLDLDDIDPLDDFPSRVREGIGASHALLAWWSRDYAESEHCLAELMLAWQHARRHGSDVGRRVWVVNPEMRGEHVLAGELSARQFLSAPTPGDENAWVQDLIARLDELVADGTLANETHMVPAPRFINVPVPSNEFTGRTAERLRIHTRLHVPRIDGVAVPAAVQVYGLGGVGKTALAAKYAHDFARAYPGGVVWLDLAGYQPGGEAQKAAAEHAWYAAVETAFSGEHEMLYDETGRPRPAARVRRTLEERFEQSPPYLWILDNVPVLVPESERDAILTFWRAPGGDGRTLITTRDARRAAGFEELPLDVLDADDGLRLLAKYCRPSPAEEPIARELVDQVGGHALALALLGEQLRDAPERYEGARSRLTEAGLLDRIEAIAADLGPELGGKARGIVATLSVSVESLHEDAQVVLAYASVCAPNELIPIALLRAAMARLDASLARRRNWLRPWRHKNLAPVADRLARGLRELQRASLLSRGVADTDSVVIHPLVAEAAPRLLEVARADVAELLASALLSRIEGTAADIRKHAAIALDIRQASHLIRTHEAETTAWIALWIGRFEHGRGAFVSARAAEERAVDLGRRMVGDEYPVTMLARVNLAGTLQAQGDLAGARALQEQAIEVLKKYLDEDNEMMLSALDNLGTMLLEQGRVFEAREIHERTLQARRRVLGPDHPQTLVSQNNLALVLGHQGDLAAARALCEEALAASRRVNGDEHPDTIRLMNNLAQILAHQGELEAAQSVGEDALALYRAVCGERHPDTLRGLANLAALLAHGDPARARAPAEEAFALSLRYLGEEHTDTLRAMGTLAMVLHSVGVSVRACELNERALELYRLTLGDENVDALRAASNQALILAAAGDLDGARRINERTLEIYTRTLGEDHPEALLSAGNLATVLGNQGDTKAARSLLERVLERQRQRVGSAHPHAIASAWNLLTILQRMEDHEAVAKLLAEPELRTLASASDNSLPRDLRALKAEAAALYRT